MAMAVVLVWFPFGHAAMAVFDSANFSQNVLQSARLLQEINLTIRDLAPLADMATILALVQDLQGLMGQLQAISSRVTGRASWWGSVGIPTSSYELAVFRAQALSACRLATLDGLSAQSLIGQANQLMNTLTRVIAGLQGVLGSVQGLQSVAGLLGTVSGHLAVLYGLQASFNESLLCQQWMANTGRAAMELIGQEQLRSWGTLRGQ